MRKRTKAEAYRIVNTHFDLWRCQNDCEVECKFLAFHLSLDIKSSRWHQIVLLPVQTETWNVCIWFLKKTYFWTGGLHSGMLKGKVFFSKQFLKADNEVHICNIITNAELKCLPLCKVCGRVVLFSEKRFFCRVMPTVVLKIWERIFYRQAIKKCTRPTYNVWPWKWSQGAVFLFLHLKPETIWKPRFSSL